MNVPAPEEREEPAPDPSDPIRIDFVDKDIETVHYYAQFRSFDGAGGGDWSYNPELREMGLKVGSDGKLHRIGPDARHPDDPDDGPVVPWSELRRKQFGR